MVRHKNSYGRWENLDRLPVRDCSCDKCENARSRQSSGRRRGGGAIARGIAAAGIVGAVGSAYAQPEQDDTNTEQRYGQSSAYAEGARQARNARGGTRDKGSRDRSSSQE
jgi:hypothetical protein